MLSGSITYQILRSESPSTIASVKSILEKHPWYETNWKEQLEMLPTNERDEMLFMLAPRWADDIRRQDRAQYHREPWHYVNWPFRSEGQPTTVQPKPPEQANIHAALKANEKSASSEPNPERRAVALTWLFHLVGDAQQPLHTVQMFTVDYPNGDRGGNEICIRRTPTTKPTNLHAFWDNAITSTQNIGQLKVEATALRNRTELGRDQLTELAARDYESWVYESHQIARQIVYQNGKFIGTPKGSHRNCSEVINAAVLPPGYARIARRIGDRRIVLAGYRLADVLKRVSGE